MKISTKIILIKIFSLVFFTFSSCKKEDIIPYVRFYEQIDLNLPKYQNVKIPGNYMYLSNEYFGYNGVILYCVSTNEYMAYERNCPHDAQKANAILDVIDSLCLMVCRDCGSRFFLIDGLKLDGPSKYSVKTYQTSLSINNILDIYNL